MYQTLTITINPGPRDTKAHNFFATAVKTRDRFCARCDNPHNLHAHHIISYSLAPELAYDVDNGCSLCSNCHKEFHATYGKQTNDEELDSFLGYHFGYYEEN